MTVKNIVYYLKLLTINHFAKNGEPSEISLMLAGHMHGGQVKFPIYGAIAFVNDPRLKADFIEVDGKHVLVTTGVGCTGPQIRFGVPPEIAVLSLFADK